MHHHLGAIVSPVEKNFGLFGQLAHTAVGNAFADMIAAFINHAVFGFPIW